MPGVVCVGEWEWQEISQLWSLFCRLVIPNAGNGIPSTTDWYIVVAPDYPWGSIKVFPAQQNGIQGTYWHQSYNGQTSTNELWRAGDLCLSTTVRVLGRTGLDTEPFEAELRLRWHIERAIQWLTAAITGTLTLPDEPFELPQYPLGESSLLAFNEAATSLEVWGKFHAHSGTVALLPIRREPSIFVTQSFRTKEGNEVYSPDWGDLIEQQSAPPETGFWIRLHSVPICPPWQAPMSWGELREACQSQEIDLDGLLRPLVRHARDGKPRLLCIGFPIPAQVQGQASRIHWLCLRLPVLTREGANVRGFRPSEKALWINDRQHRLSKTSALSWVHTENWNDAEITVRGRLPKSITDCEVLLLGAGALGAPLAQMLVRAGVRSMMIVDRDVLSIGNLSRHPSSVRYLSLPKAHTLAAELRLASPHVKVSAVVATFPELPHESRQQVGQCDLILDCTGDDSVIQALETFGWASSQTKIVSLSLGIEAKQLFVYTAPASNFHLMQFRERMAPWLDNQLERFGELDLPREGIGCWHPVFPARIDDVWLHTAAAVKEIERVVTSDVKTPNLTVFEQTTDADGNFTGIQRVAMESKTG